jgi:hypothetical protein
MKAPTPAIEMESEVDEYPKFHISVGAEIVSIGCREFGALAISHHN